MDIFGIFYKNDGGNNADKSRLRIRKHKLEKFGDSFFYSIKGIKQQIFSKNESTIQIAMTNDRGFNSSYQNETRLDNCSTSHSLLISYNVCNNKLQIQTDRFATIPVYYYDNDDVFIFSNLINNIIEFIPQDRRINLRVANEIIDFGYALYDSTIIEGVFELLYSCILTVDEVKTNIDRYWDFSIDETDRNINVIDIQKQLANYFKKAVSRCLDDTQNILLPLSGGLDSRAILAEAIDHIGTDKILLYTVGKNSTQDIEIAKSISKNYGIDHALCYLSNEDDEIYNEIDWKEYYHQKISQNSGLIEVLPGDPPVDNLFNLSPFSDTIFSGYMGDPLFASHLNNGMLREISKFEESYSEILFSQNIVKSNLNDEVDTHYSSPPNYLINKLKQYHSFAALSMHWDFSVRQQKYIKYGQITKYRNRLKAQAPFIDSELFNFICNDIPFKYKLNEQIYVDMLLQEYPKLFENIPTTYSAGLKINEGKIKKLVNRVGSKVNKVTGKKIYPYHLKVNTINWSQLITKQSSLRKYYVEIIERAQSAEIISMNHGMKLLSGMEKNNNYAHQVGRICTVVEAMDYYKLK